MFGLIVIVCEGDFLGVVVEIVLQVCDIVEVLIVYWCILSLLFDMFDLYYSLKVQFLSLCLLDGLGDFDWGIVVCGIWLLCIYLWFYYEYGLIGLFCVVVDWNDGCFVVWSGMQNLYMLCGDLVVLMQLELSQIEVWCLQVVGCYGCNCVDDVCGDVLLMFKVVGCLVCV